MKKGNLMVLHDTRWVILGVLALALSACCSPSQHLERTFRDGRVFATPEEAVDAYIFALRNNDRPELLRVLGSNSTKLIYSGDSVADKTWHAKFLAAYDTAHKIESDGPAKDELVIGSEEWPTPIPLVQTYNGWQWDSAAGEEEILNRRIGHNELTVIGVARTYVDAQREFASQHIYHGQKEYAQKFVSSRGKHDGLYWPTRSGEAESPLGPLVAEARAEGYTAAGTQIAKHKPQPFHGYYFKILTQQGPAASGGAKPYVIDGHMTGGFGLLAFPAKYGDSGVMSFIVNQNGIVYEKNLGPDTREIALSIATYDPDESWTISDTASAE